METHLMAFDVAVKRGNFLQAARAACVRVWRVFVACFFFFLFLLSFFLSFFNLCLVCVCVFFTC